ncbi:MAG: tRNA-(ms[2]io[6]A)-hydroxylase, partial [Desertifilum sp. SIO1I2]|nr:tRNA-(ms[2]io[6]A)-hydroxylase [Desertifilum sp. SIO1I2]
LASEARHYGAYWILATTYYPKEVVNARLAELAPVESELLSTLHAEPRIHS